MNGKNVSPVAKSMTGRLTLADYKEVASRSNAGQKVRLDDGNEAKLDTRRDSLPTRLVRFFHSIAEFLRLAKPTAVSQRQQMAAQKFQSLIRQSGHTTMGIENKKTYKHSDIIRVLNQADLQNKKAEMNMRAACGLKAPRDQVEEFSATVKQQTGHDVNELLGLAPTLDKDSAVQTTMNSDLWLKYQSHLDAIAKSQAGPWDGDKLSWARQAAARLVVATACPKEHLDVSSRAYRQSIQELAGMLRRCAQPSDHAGVTGMVYILKRFQEELEIGLKGQAVGKQESQMMFDVMLNEALNSLSPEEKNGLFSALRADENNLQSLMQGLGDFPKDLSTIHGIVQALQRNSQTFIHMPKLIGEETEAGEQAADMASLVRQAQSDYDSVKHEIHRSDQMAAPAETIKNKARSTLHRSGSKRTSASPSAADSQQVRQDQHMRTIRRRAEESPHAKTLQDKKIERQKEAYKEKVMDAALDLREQIKADRTLERADSKRLSSELNAARQERQKTLDRFEKNVIEKASELPRPSKREPS